MALLAVRSWWYAIILALVGTIVAIATPKKNPVDNDITRKHQFVTQLYVTDSTHNGFRLSYFTNESVSTARADIIRNRPDVIDSLERLKESAPVVFGNMLNTDIYEFARYASRFDPDDIHIHNIFVYGRDKENLYIGENPRIKNWAKYINPITAQGLLYLGREEIYHNGTGNFNGHKVYRYFECYGLHQISDTDEHFSHFSEDERIY